MAEATIGDAVSRTAHAHGVSLGEAFRVWLRVAALSFGGPAGQIAVMHRIIVEEKKWVGESRFLHALSYCMLLPGPEAHQLAIYIGWLMHRWPDASIMPAVSSTNTNAPTIMIAEKGAAMIKASARQKLAA